MFSVAILSKREAFKSSTARQLQLHGIPVEQFENSRELMAARHSNHSLILADLSECDASAVEAFAHLRRHSLTPPLMIVGLMHSSLPAFLSRDLVQVTACRFDFFVPAPLELNIIFNLLRLRDPVLREECNL